MMTLYYLMKEFGLWYLLGLPLVFMVLGTVSMILGAKMNRFMRVLIVLGWPVAVPVLYILLLVSSSIRGKFAKWRNHEKTE